MRWFFSLIVRIIKQFFILCCLIAVIYLSICGYVVFAGKTTYPSSADAIIVLGAAAWGEKPSPVFKERINHAVDLYHANIAKKIIFTGGTPKLGFATEASVGANWAVKNGVSPEHIFTENQSRNTLQNLQNSLEIAQDKGLNSFIIVSDPYHIARAKMMAHDLNINAQMSATPTSRFNQASLSRKWKFISQEANRIIIYTLSKILNLELYDL